MFRIRDNNVTGRRYEFEKKMSLQKPTYFTNLNSLGIYSKIMANSPQKNNT